MKPEPSAAALRHSIGRQAIHVTVAAEAQAHALLERVAALNRERLLPAIEQVLDEFDRPGKVIRIDRLDLNLGRFAEARLGDVEARLAEALRAALRRAVGTDAAASPAAEEQAGVAPTRDVLAEAFGHYLGSGAWPYRSVLDPATPPARLFARLLDESPDALVAMLRAGRSSDRAVRRLVRQMPGPLLERLLGVLDPDSAHWILPYMEQTRAAHRVEPIVDQPAEEFASALWFVVLRDALHRSGLRANRRAFVAKLIADLAMSLGADPADLLSALRRGLEAAPSAALGDSSLLSILAEIEPAGADSDGAETGSDAAPRRPGGLADPAAAFEALESALERGASSPRAAIASAAAAARRFGLAGARADDRDSARALLGALAAHDAARLRRLLRASTLPSILAETGSAAAARGPGGLADPAAAFEALGSALERGASSPRAAIASAAAAARRFGLAPARADDRDSARALLGALAGEDPARLRRVLRASAAPDGRAAAALLAACDPDEAADLILPPHLATAMAGLIRIAGCDRPESEALLAAAGAIPRSAPAALAFADLARLLASRRGLSADALLARLQAEALAAGGEAGLTVSTLLDEAAAPTGRAYTAAVRRELALETLRALLGGRLVGSPGGESEAALAALAGTGADRIRREIALAGLQPRTAAAALSRLSSRALLRLVALLAPGGGGREDLRAALAEAGRDRARLAALAAWLIAGGAAPPGPPRLAAVARGSARQPPAPTRRDRDREERELFLLLRRDPAAALAQGTETGSDFAGLALLFSRLPEADRREAEAMARRLSGPAARRALGAGLVIGSLVAAVCEALARRSGGSFAGLWRAALAAAASTAEQEALDRLLPPSEERRETLGAPMRPPEPGSAAWLLALIEAPPDEARQGLRLLRSAALRRRLSRRLPRHLLARLLFAARPHEARALLGSADLIRGAFAAEGRSIAPDALWDALLDSALAPPGAALDRLVERLVPAGAGESAVLVPALLARARAARHGPLAAALEDHPAAVPAERRPKPRPVAEAGPAGASERTYLDREDENPIFVPNAGLVIAAPFLGSLCERAGLSAGADEAFRWVGPEAAGRAVHLLQYLVDGRTDAPEPMLALNKVLCGLDPSWPAPRAIEMTPVERETCDSLLASMLAQWPALSGSSVAALRETFLERQGRLSRADQSWRLEVERKTVDVLLEMLPWGFSTILTPWSPHPLFVAW